MPNGDDTVRVQLPDGRTGTIPKSSLPKAQRKGWKVIDSPVVAGAKTFGREAALGAFGGLGISETMHPVQDTAKAAFTPPPMNADSIASALLGPGYGVAKGLAGSAGEIAQGFGVGGSADIGKVGHGFGGLLSQILALKGGEKAAEKPTGESSAVKSVVKPIVRDVLGAGEKDVARQMEKTATKESAVHAKAEAKVEKAKQNYADAVQEALKKRAEASAKETAAKTKQEALVSKHGPVYKRMNEMADDAREHVAKVEQTVKQAESAKWSEFNQKMGDARVETNGTSDAIANAQKNILSGESVPVFKQILGEIGEGDGELTQILQNAAPEVREQALKQGILPQEGVPLDTARRLYTKISQKLNGSELPRNVSRALYTVQDALDSSIAESVAKKGGADALKNYRKLQADWKQYRQTFSDKDSPLRKIMEAKDPNTKLGPLTSETGARAIDYLGRYRNMGADPSKLGRIRALHKSLKELQGGGGKAPAMPERPELPSTPVAKPNTPEAARKEILQGKGASYSRPPSKWELMFPPLLIYKMGLKHLLQNPEVIKWLSKEKSGNPLP